MTSHHPALLQSVHALMPPLARPRPPPLRRARAPPLVAPVAIPIPIPFAIPVAIPIPVTLPFAVAVAVAIIGPPTVVVPRPPVVPLVARRPAPRPSARTRSGCCCTRRPARARAERAGPRRCADVVFEAASLHLPTAGANRGAPLAPQAALNRSRGNRPQARHRTARATISLRAYRARVSRRPPLQIATRGARWA